MNCHSTRKKSDVQRKCLSWECCTVRMQHWPHTVTMFQIPTKILHNNSFLLCFFLNWIDSKIEEILSYRPKCQAVQRSWLVDRHFCPWWALRVQSVDDYDQHLNLFYQLQLYRRYLFDLNQFRFLHRCCFRCYLFQCVVYQLRLVKNGKKNREKLLKIIRIYIWKVYLCMKNEYVHFQFWNWRFSFFILFIKSPNVSKLFL